MVFNVSFFKPEICACRHSTSGGGKPRPGGCREDVDLVSTQIWGNCVRKLLPQCFFIVT